LLIAPFSLVAGHTAPFGKLIGWLALSFHSRQAIKKYIKANNKLGDITDATFNSHINRALATGEKNGEFLRPKGASGPVKLAKKESKPAAAKKESKPAAKSATKKSTTKAAPKKAATTKKATTTKAAAPKKAAAKPKANASKPRKTASSVSVFVVRVQKVSHVYWYQCQAPAVVDKPVVLGKTKSGRVTKTKATTAAKAKKPAAKKASTTKKATPKKAAAPAAPAAAAWARRWVSQLLRFFRVFFTVISDGSCAKGCVFLLLGRERACRRVSAMGVISWVQLRKRSSWTWVVAGFGSRKTHLMLPFDLSRSVRCCIAIGILRVGILGRRFAAFGSGGFGRIVY
jgi:histone H1/5